MAFKRMLADAAPDTAARAAMRMAQAVVQRSSVSAATRAQAQRVLDLGVDELSSRLSEAREREATQRDVKRHK
jgi:hypothetical protein